jgi:DNA-binding NarL/FixJ family response regulator
VDTTGSVTIAAGKRQDKLVTQRILIVDDSKLARMAVIKALNALRPGWTRLEASNAEEALAMVLKDAPDIALLDFNMPGKDGLVLAAEIRKVAPQTTLAVISANHQVEVINRAREAGAAFLPKPLTEKSLGDFLSSAAK